MRGLSHDEPEPDAVIDALADAAAPYRVERDVKIVALATQMDDLRADIAKTHDELAKSEATLAAMRAEADMPQARLQRFVQTFVIFFSEQEVLIEPAAVAQGLDALATMLHETNSNLRVVGYADETGSAATNRSQSRRRADKVISMLVERGVPRERLALAPRAYTDVLADSGPGYLRNRRVLFELPYAHEFDIK
jgi:outer membrane protein OmpA-like peptidoglycan-associated protein